MPHDWPLRLVRLTPPGRGAIATLLVEGPGALQAVASHFYGKSGPATTSCSNGNSPSPPAPLPQGEREAVAGRTLSAAIGGRLVFGRFGSPGGEEVVVRCRSDQSVELHCHGGQAAIARIEEALVQRGARVMAWQEWAFRRHQDPIAAAAWVALAQARTERVALILLDQYAGALRRAIDAIRQLLHGEDLTAAGRQLDVLLSRAGLGRHLVEPWRVVLAGPPNVGKSSLINALVGYPRAIVHPAAGTTRDAVTATTAVDGWPVELSDTAGLREGSHAIEQAGVELARQRMAAADLVVLVFDASQPWSEADEMLAATRPKAILVHNKADLPASSAPRPAGMATSALTGQGVEPLIRSIAGRLVAEPPEDDAAVPFTGEQIQRLCQAREALHRSDATEAVSLLAAT